MATFWQIYQTYKDKTVVWVKSRWLLFMVLLGGYVFRVIHLKGFHVVSYTLAIYLLNALIAFLQPITDEDDDAPVLPVKEEGEFKSFQRKLPEFQCWWNATVVTGMCLLLTMFPFLDIPVFWPILIIYFLFLFVFAMRKQIAHMYKYGYIPFDLGKKKYNKNIYK